MSGYTFTKPSAITQHEITFNYVGAVKNGNKLTLVISGEILINVPLGSYASFGTFTIPKSVADKIIPYAESISGVGNPIELFSLVFTDKTATLVGSSKSAMVNKPSDTRVGFLSLTNGLTAGATYLFRIEKTYLLGENLANSEE